MPILLPPALKTGAHRDTTTAFGLFAAHEQYDLSTVRRIRQPPSRTPRTARRARRLAWHARRRLDAPVADPRAFERQGETVPRERLAPEWGLGTTDPADLVAAADRHPETGLDEPGFRSASPDQTAFVETGRRRLLE